jgi:L-gulonate 5-dehydrogenase
VIEATGNAKAMESTIDLVAAGGRIVIVGLVPKGKLISLPGLDFTRKEVTIVGSRASVNCFPEALELLASGAITYPQVASEFNMWEAPQVFADLTAHPNAVHKAVLVTN